MRRWLFGSEGAKARVNPAQARAGACRVSADVGLVRRRHTAGFAQQRAALAALHETHLLSHAFAARFESGLGKMNGQIDRSLGYAAVGYNAEEIAKIDKGLAQTAASPRPALVDHQAVGSLRRTSRS